MACSSGLDAIPVAPDHIFSSLAISAMTCTASITSIELGKLDLQSIWESVAVDPEGLACIRNTDATECRPPDLLRTGTVPFGTQLTALVRIRHRPDAHANVKIFANGALQITGVRSRSETMDVARTVSGAIGMAAPHDIRVRMVNANMRTDPPLPRKGFVEYVQSLQGMHAVFDPSISPTAKVYICFAGKDETQQSTVDGACPCPTHCATKKSQRRNCYVCVALIHKTGTVMIKGACGESHIERSAEVIKRLSAAHRRAYA